jgi:multidrug transporter EmrE-like cation transporter
MTKILFFLGLFWLVQAVVQIGFKLSSVHEHRFLLYFCAAHAIGVPSLWFVTELYKRMSEPLAFGLAFGGAFLAAQLALFVVFRPATSLTQWVGVLAICAGMVLLAVGSPKLKGGEAGPAESVAAQP